MSRSCAIWGKVDSPRNNESTRLQRPMQYRRDSTPRTIVIVRSRGEIRMNVQAIGASTLPKQFSRRVELSGLNKTAKTEAIQKHKAPTGETTGLTPSAGQTSESWESERAHGVLRLLMAGHFKAVPEQHLRANFADLLPPPPDDSDTQTQPDDSISSEVEASPATVDAIMATEARPLSGDVGISLEAVNLFA
jgi:hypothetical protein